MTDLLANGAGAYVTSDHGGITLLMISTDTPNQATVRRVRLESGISLTQLIDAAVAHGAPVMVNIRQMDRDTPSIFKRPCPVCHRLVTAKTIKRHIEGCAARGGAKPRTGRPRNPELDRW